MRMSVYHNVWERMRSLAGFLCCVCAAIAWAAGSGSPVAPHTAHAQQLMPGLDGEAVLSEMLNGVAIPGEVSSLATGIYTRHRTEIIHILNENPDMIWNTVDLALDALPSLRAVQENKGLLIIDKRIYGKATGLMDQYRSMASAGLARDLVELEKYLDSRTVEMDSQRLRVNLR